jgi:5-methylcytosine-specific restriction protein A
MFERGCVYHRRSDIHARYGGQEQGGISTPRQYPYIFLFSSDSGEAYGYCDGWVDADTFRYSGEGQRGDMQLLRGNRAIANHAESGKELHLFQKVDKGLYRYEGEMEYTTHDMEERTADVEGRVRTAIVFTLKRVGS